MADGVVNAQCKAHGGSVVRSSLAQLQGPSFILSPMLSAVDTPADPLPYASAQTEQGQALCFAALAALFSLGGRGIGGRVHTQGMSPGTAK